MAMHQMLGHDLNIDWSGMAACSQSSTMSYPHQAVGAFNYEPQPAPQWPSPPASIMDSTPSPLEESPPRTPEHLLSDFASDPLMTQDAPAAVASQPIPQPVEPTGEASSSNGSTFPLVVTSATNYEHTVAFQTDVRLSIVHAHVLPR